MKLFKLLVIGVVLGAGAYFAFVRVSRAQYGTNDENPLGTFEKLDSRLTGEAGLAKAAAPRASISGVEETDEMYDYVNPRNQYERMLLLLDENRRVIGVVGTYVVSETGSRSPVMLFVRAHWRRSGGPGSPEFGPALSTPVPTGAARPLAGMLGNITTSEAKFVRGGIEGTWRKSEWQGAVYETIILRVQ